MQRYKAHPNIQRLSPGVSWSDLAGSHVRRDLRSCRRAVAAHRGHRPLLGAALPRGGALGAGMGRSEPALLAGADGAVLAAAGLACRAC